MKKLSAILNSSARTTWSAWDRFWFQAYHPRAMTVLRTSIGFLLFLFYLIRAADLRWFFSDSGLLTWSTIVETMPIEFRYSLLQFFPSDGAVLFLHTLFLVSLLTMAMGWWPRISAFVAFVLHVSFMHRNMPIVFGADLIATFFLFYLCFMKTTGAPAASSSLTAYVSSIALRFGQIQVCIIYAFSGWEKLKGPSWWKGEAIWTVFANAQLARWDFSWTSHLPFAIILATYLTLLWEIYFPALVWLRKWRPVMLIFGVLMHLGIGIVVNIPFFGLLMVFTYSVFLTEAEAGWILQRIKSLKRLCFREPQGSRISSQV